MITLKTLPQATEQEVFDQVAKHLLTQNQTSGVKGISCWYRDGHLKCAAGCIIGDDEYRNDFEGLTWEALVSKKLVPSQHSTLISSLQRLHDGSYPREWREKLEALAHSRSLSISVLETK